MTAWPSQLSNNGGSVRPSQKHEIRSTKSETNSNDSRFNDRNESHSPDFRHSALELGICFVLRISDFEFCTLVPSPRGRAVPVRSARMLGADATNWNSFRQSHLQGQ